MTARAQLLRSATVFAAVSAAWAVAVHNHYRELNPARIDTTKVMWEAGTSPIPDSFTVVKFPREDCQVSVGGDHRAPFHQPILTSWKRRADGRIYVPYGKPGGSVSAADFTFNCPAIQRDLYLRSPRIGHRSNPDEVLVTFSTPSVATTTDSVHIREAQGILSNEYTYQLQGEQVTPLRWTQDTHTPTMLDRHADLVVEDFYTTRWVLGQFALTFVALTGYMFLRARRQSPQKTPPRAEDQCQITTKAQST